MKATSTRVHSMKQSVFLSVMTLLSVQAVSSFAACTAGTNLTVNKPDNIYLDNVNGTVTDGETGLMWKKCSEGMSYSAGACTGTATSTFSWKTALERAVVVNGDTNLNLGYTDWRVPNVNELDTLVDRGCSGTLRINTTVFPSTVAGVYWSSTPYGLNTTTNPANAWYVNFGSGIESTTTKISASSRYLRLVRDAQ